MVFWLPVIALALIVALLLALAAMRGKGGGPDRADYDVAVYRDQLKGVDKDLDRGVIDSETADRLRLEISRRLLEADKARSASDAGNNLKVVNLGLAITLVAVVGGGSVALYRSIGMPGYGDLPLKLRLEASQSLYENRPSQEQAQADAAASGRMPIVPEPDPEYAALVARLRTAVEGRDADIQGLMLLAQNEATLGNYVAAHEAQRRLIDALGDRVNADAFSEYADMLVLAAGGYVSPEAEQALTRALALDPENRPARYYSGLMYAQTGRPDLAFRVWRELLRVSSPQDPWVGPIQAQLPEMAVRAGVEFTPEPLGQSQPQLSGPSTEDMQAAQDLSEEDRMAMIEGMVAGLAERLATEGGSAPEWARLITALSVLGETDNAIEIWREAQTVFQSDAESLQVVNAAANAAGLSE